MSNCLFAFPNRADSGTLSGGSWEATLPLTNLQDYRQSKVARSTNDDLASTIINLDLGSDLYIWVVALTKHNLSQAAQFRVRGSNDNTFATSVYDSDWVDVYGEVFPPNVLNFGDPGYWDGKIAAVDYALGYTVDIIHVLPTPQTSRYWRIEIDDTANADGYVEFGRLWVSYAYQPTINFDGGAAMGWQTESTTTITDGGEAVHDDRPRRRVFNFTLGQIPGNEAFVRGFEMTRQLGTTGQLFFVYDPTDTYHMSRRAFVCRMESLSRISIPYAAWHEQGFSLIEEL